MLRYIRIFVALVTFSFLTLYFIDISDELPTWMSAFAKIQFFSALVSGCIGAVVFVLLLTLLTGRLYCSTICPLGIMQDLIAWSSKRLIRKKKYACSRAKTKTRWGFFALFVLAVVCGWGSICCLLEPYSIYGRTMFSVVAPVYETINNLLTWICLNCGIVYFYYVDPTRLLFGTLVAVTLFVVIAYLSFRWGRTWCNVVCPVGTFLGLLSRLALLKIRFDKSKCSQCGLCSTKCKAGCLDGKNQLIDYSRCVDCFNCLGACRQKALYWGAGWGGTQELVPQNGNKESVKEVQTVHEANDAKGAAASGPDPSKREFLGSLVTLAMLSTSVLAEEHSGNTAGKKSADTVSGESRSEATREPYDEHLERRKTPLCPPGAKSQIHLKEHCTGCHLCVAACPSHVLQPSFLEYGLSGMLMPLMRFEKGFCNFDCLLCGEVCPNGAIEPLTIGEKHLIQMGKVHFVRDRCIVYQDGTNCGACSEHCPTQAVTMVPFRGSLTIPEIHPEICVGCGGCESICPVRPDRAIFVEGNLVQIDAEPFKESKKETIKIDNFGF
ncbi:MAG: 4Fe-4S dicluster domain-containing protein [Thermoguttaceae bacterium]|nr:4Fe-4S dicluster domain-containing protein [Thermoguttaceae bacterium]